jgi:hypothetical protein
MGVTIHYEGRLKGPDSYSRLMEVARAFADREGWRVEPINEVQVTLQRVRDEQDWDYTGPTRGLTILPREDAEPMRLEFDRDLYVQEFVKTQFAPPEVHVKIVALLRALAPQFETLEVDDEGKYWDTDDIETLRRHIWACNRVLAEELKARPGLRGPVRLPSGRIVDYMSD